MSRKQQARITLKQALGDAARVDKIRGQLVVFRTEAKGRVKDWQAKVKREIKRLLPGWEVAKLEGGLIIFKLVMPKEEKP